MVFVATGPQFSLAGRSSAATGLVVNKDGHETLRKLILSIPAERTLAKYGHSSTYDPIC